MTIATLIPDRVRSILFNRLKKFFFKILNFLHPNFLTNMGLSADDFASASRMTRTQVEESVEEGRHIVKSRLTQTVILNDNSTAVSKNVIQDLLEGIFESPERIAFVLKICGSQLQAGQTLQQVEGLIEDSLKAHLAQNPSSTETSLALGQVTKHRARSRANSLAYSSQEKLKPSAIWWPDPTDSQNARSLRSELPYVLRTPLIDRETPIVSAGSCFATEIARVLQMNGYNYVITEGNKAADGSYEVEGAEADITNASAAWGIIFNTPSFRQLVEKAFNERELPRILWTQTINGRPRHLDPFRENVSFPSPEAFEANYEVHRQATREALLKAKVLVVTPGVNEVWYFRADGSVFSRSPWRIAPSLVEHKCLSVQENLADLQRMLDILRVHNPELKLIVTLSPVPLHATFRAENTHVITANTHSKAVLRVALEEFVRRNKEVYYFPSYELITQCLEQPWEADQRHVTREAVSQVMKLFGEMFYKT